MLDKRMMVLSLMDEDDYFDEDGETETDKDHSDWSPNPQPSNIISATFLMFISLILGLQRYLKLLFYKFPICSF